MVLNFSLFASLIFLIQNLEDWVVFSITTLFPLKKGYLFSMKYSETQIGKTGKEIESQRFSPRQRFNFNFISSSGPEKYVVFHHITYTQKAI